MKFIYNDVDTIDARAIPKKSLDQLKRILGEVNSYESALEMASLHSEEAVEWVLESNKLVDNEAN